jgi:uncharacterized protein (TIGR01244 family)
MSQFRTITDQLAVSPQITTDDVAEAARQGFKAIINNRPDGEEPGQPRGADIEAAARAAGMTYAHIPVLGMPTPDQVEAQRQALAEAGGPTLAFCRSGNRCMVIWSLGQAQTGERTPDELIRLGAEAGYNLAPILAR